ncbi:MAG: NAD-dependent deacylase [Candidatus Marinimicrobia bacterium]|nr:NAD-dependent deacylase [Candidatus Neomarinimicrobiota bacterium]
MKILSDPSAIEAIKKAKNIVALTGAGISAESGIPTFRGENGLWTKLSPEELASFESFYQNTAVVMEWYKHRQEVIKKCKPNPGHYALCELSSVPEHFNLITQNIDGLHQRAGSRDVVELHGNLLENYCVRCGQKYSIEEFDDVFNNAMNHVPRCNCGGLIRPNVVWFGEALPRENLELAYNATIQSDVFLSIGTSAQVRPAADLPVLAKQGGAFLIEINTQHTVLSEEADLILQGNSGEILPQLVEDIKTLLPKA